MEFSAQQIADFLNGEIIGDPTVRVSNFSKIEEGTEGTLSFLSNPKYSHHLYDSKASIVLVNKNLDLERAVSATLIRVENAYDSLAQLMTLVEQFAEKKTGISTLAYIAPTAQIGENAYISPFANIAEGVVIGANAQIYSHVSVEKGTKIGDNVIIFSGVKIYKDSLIGDNCIFHAGAVVGADGFGFAPNDDGSYRKIPQLGNVIIEDNVELGANCTIDRATFGSTILRKGVKIDNLVQVAHNVEVGENTVIAAQSGIAGSTKIGRSCILAGQVGVSGHLHIADGSIFGAQTGVSNSIKSPNLTYLGYPALPVGNFRRSTVVFKQLPELQKMVFDLKKRIAELEENQKTSK